MGQLASPGLKGLHLRPWSKLEPIWIWIPSQFNFKAARREEGAAGKQEDSLFLNPAATETLKFPFTLPSHPETLRVWMLVWGQRVVYSL